MKPVYVIGHKNPDVDSIASAIGYAEFKTAIQPGRFLPAAAGPLNSETRFLLTHLGIDEPFEIPQVGTVAQDLLAEGQPMGISPDMDLHTLGDLMRQKSLKTVPVVGLAGEFLGLVTIGDLALIFLDRLGKAQLSDTPGILRELLAQKAGDIMKSQDLVLFEHDDPLEDVRKNMLATRFRNYPVVDENHRFLGLISRYSLLAMRRKQLILVDHNELKQAVDGVEEAEVLEIIDHHRVGDIQTLSPIYFHNEPVGATSTLVADHFMSRQIPIPAPLAALLLAGILTDTMLYKSPTITAKDRRVAAALEEISGLNGIQWGKQILENGQRFESLDDRSMVLSDLKEYEQDGLVFAIAQVETVDLSRLNARKADLRQVIEEICRERGYRFMCLMTTDIVAERTELIIAGDDCALVEQAFARTARDGVIVLAGVMSRKKQVVPVVIQTIRQRKNL